MDVLVGVWINFNAAILIEISVETLLKRFKMLAICVIDLHVYLYIIFMLFIYLCLLICKWLIYQVTAIRREGMLKLHGNKRKTMVNWFY